MPANSKQQTLYSRLGGHAGVKAVVDDFVVRMVTHPQVGHFFARLDTSPASRFRAQLVDFICAAVGGDARYRGRDMACAHVAFNISDSDWQVTVESLRESLIRAGVPAVEIGEVLAVIDPLKQQIVKHS
jgi:hemoglobin